MAGASGHLPRDVVAKAQTSEGGKIKTERLCEDADFKRFPNLPARSKKTLALDRSDTSPMQRREVLLATQKARTDVAIVEDLELLADRPDALSEMPSVLVHYQLAQLPRLDPT